MPRPGTPRAHHRHPKTGKLIPASRRSQRYPDQYREGNGWGILSPTTKLRGLKKLRLITKELGGIARVAPYKVYRFTDQFRKEHLRGAPRILVRTDEIGKRYRRTYYSKVPRADLFPENETESVLRAQLEGMNKPRGTRYIVHPTRPRKDVALVGSILLDSINGIPRVDLRIGNTVTEHYFLPDWETFYFSWKNNSFSLVRGASYPSDRILLENIETFLRRGFTTKQLRFAPALKTILRFNTWRDDLHVPEFYDLIELPT